MGLISQTKVTVTGANMAYLVLASHAMAAGRTFYSALERCPALCSDAGSSPNNWTVYHDIRRLTRCNETMLLDFAVHIPLDNPDKHISIRACAADADANPIKSGIRRDQSSSVSGNQTQIEAPLQMAWVGSTLSGNAVDVVAAAEQSKSI